MSRIPRSRNHTAQTQRRITSALACAALMALLCTPALAGEDGELPPEGGSYAPGAAQTVAAQSEEEGSDRPRFNITLNPAGILLGGASLQASVALGSLITLAGSVSYQAPILFKHHAVGGRIDMQFWPFFGPYFKVGHVTPSGDANILPTTAGYAGASIGWRWLWDSGFNMAIGGDIGYGFEIASSKCPSSARCSMQGDGLKLGIIFDVGYAF